ncbi:hypothetical protein CH262_07815 [Rhodococcus sp. 05-2255-1e]|nr:hypothetical protein CH262_07815 [Rhodococcus sp. 05-2255-1e]
MVDHDSTVVVANEMRVPPISFVIVAKDLTAHAGIAVRNWARVAVAGAPIRRMSIGRSLGSDSSGSPRSAG